MGGDAELVSCPGCSNTKANAPVYVCKSCGYKGCSACWPGSYCPRCDKKDYVRVGYVKAG